MFFVLYSWQVAGVNTNIGFLERLSAHESFQDADVHTGFIEVRAIDKPFYPTRACAVIGAGVIGMFVDKKN